MYEKRLRSHHDSSAALSGILEKYTEKKEVNKKDFEEIMSRKGENDKRVVYFHIPYCDTLCTFCNLNRELLKGNMDGYADYLISEIEEYGNSAYVKSKPFDAFYFGGGTPTTFSENNLKRILGAITDKYEYSDDYEFTFETTVHNLTREKINILNDFGVNRISIGVQTFSDRGRKLLNRTFDSKELLKKINEIRKTFRGLICIDIIYSYPGETDEEVINDAKTAGQIPADSISFYPLMIHNGSALHKMIEEKRVIFERTNETEMKLHNLFLENLDKNYNVLELSKVKYKNNDRYRYITLRYDNADTLPVGIGSGGRIGNIGIYNMNPKMSFYSYTDEKSLFYNKVLGKMQYGIYDMKYFENIMKENTFEKFSEKINNLYSEGFFYKYEEKYILNGEGIFWGNNIAVDLLGLIIESEFK
ncbi:MAG TPA: coproporphyrinogen-III oxidase family protein [Tepiditoga sp.]|nr:coproporphyrinogen III oxidase family protein [Thermotogota bacterium]HOO74603.1 coproporphyrinogen-III oxidase family protein [Tepiditoga sp.]